MTEPTAGVRPPYVAVIFDMDCILTDIAAVVAEACKRPFGVVIQPGNSRSFRAAHPS